MYSSHHVFSGANLGNCATSTCNALVCFNVVAMILLPVLADGLAEFKWINDSKVVRLKSFCYLRISTRTRTYSQGTDSLPATWLNPEIQVIPSARKRWSLQKSVCLPAIHAWQNWQFKDSTRHTLSTTTSKNKKSSPRLMGLLCSKKTISQLREAEQANSNKNLLALVTHH